MCDFAKRAPERARRLPKGTWRAHQATGCWPQPRPFPAGHGHCLFPLRNTSKGLYQGVRTILATQPSLDLFMGFQTADRKAKRNKEELNKTTSSSFTFKEHDIFTFIFVYILRLRHTLPLLYHFQSSVSLPALASRSSCLLICSVKGTVAYGSVNDGRCPLLLGTPRPRAGLEQRAVCQTPNPFPKPHLRCHLL